MSKKTLRIITIISTIVAVLCIASFNFAANSPTELSNIPNENAFDEIGLRIIGAIKAIGVLISVGVIVVLGIKYMMGSAQEKAEYKKTMIPYLIGAALIFGGTQIAGMVYNFVNNNGANA